MIGEPLNPSFYTYLFYERCDITALLNVYLLSAIVLLNVQMLFFLILWRMHCDKLLLHDPHVCTIIAV